MPLLVSRSARLAALAMPRSRSRVTALSTSPPLSSSAFRQSIMPAPVMARSFLTSSRLTARVSATSHHLLLVVRPAQELVLGHVGQVVLLVFQVLLDEVVARRLQELALLHRGQLLAPLHRLLATVE